MFMICVGVVISIASIHRETQERREGRGGINRYINDDEPTTMSMTSSPGIVLRPYSHFQPYETCSRPCPPSGDECMPNACLVVSGQKECVAVPSQEPRCNPNGNVGRLPTPFPTEYPTPLSTEYPTPFPTEYPTPFTTEYPTPLPTEYPTPMPADLTPTDTPYPTPMPTESTPTDTPYPTPMPTTVVDPVILILGGFETYGCNRTEQTVSSGVSSTGEVAVLCNDMPFQEDWAVNLQAVTGSSVRFNFASDELICTPSQTESVNIQIAVSIRSLSDSDSFLRLNLGKGLLQNVDSVENVLILANSDYTDYAFTLGALENEQFISLAFMFQSDANILIDNVRIVGGGELCVEITPSPTSFPTSAPTGGGVPFYRTLIFDGFESCAGESQEGELFDFTAYNENEQAELIFNGLFEYTCSVDDFNGNASSGSLRMRAQRSPSQSVCGLSVTLSEANRFCFDNNNGFLSFRAKNSGTSDFLFRLKLEGPQGSIERPSGSLTIPGNQDEYEQYTLSFLGARENAAYPFESLTFLSYQSQEATILIDDIRINGDLCAEGQGVSLQQTLLFSGFENCDLIAEDLSALAGSDEILYVESTLDLQCPSGNSGNSALLMFQTFQDQEISIVLAIENNLCFSSQPGVIQVIAKASDQTNSTFNLQVTLKESDGNEVSLDKEVDVSNDFIIYTYTFQDLQTPSAQEPFIVSEIILRGIGSEISSIFIDEIRSNGVLCDRAQYSTFQVLWDSFESCPSNLNSLAGYRTIDPYVFGAVSPLSCDINGQSESIVMKWGAGGSGGYIIPMKSVENLCFEEGNLQMVFFIKNVNGSAFSLEVKLESGRDFSSANIDIEAGVDTESKQYTVTFDENEFPNPVRQIVFFSFNVNARGIVIEDVLFGGIFCPQTYLNLFDGFVSSCTAPTLDLSSYTSSDPTLTGSTVDCSSNQDGTYISITQGQTSTESSIDFRLSEDLNIIVPGPQTQQDLQVDVRLRVVDNVEFTLKVTLIDVDENVVDETVSSQTGTGSFEVISLQSITNIFNFNDPIEGVLLEFTAAAGTIFDIDEILLYLAYYDGTENIERYF